MSKNTISTFSLVVLLAAVLWFFHLSRESEKNAAADLEPADFVVAMPRPTPGVAATSTPRLPPAAPARAAEVSGELEVLEQQLATAQQTLQSQRQAVEELQKRNQVFAAQVPARDSTLNVMRSEAQVQNAMLEIDSYRNLENQINRYAEDQIRIQNSVAQAQIQQTEESLRVQQGLIQQTREDILFWTYNFNDQTRQQSELQRLQDLLAAQSNQLELMLQQRMLIAAEALSATQTIQAQKQEALVGLLADQDSIQGDIESLRDSIIRLQQSQREIRNTQISLGSQLQRAQQALQTQEAQVRNLESAIQQKKQELDSLVQ